MNKYILFLYIIYYFQKWIIFNDVHSVNDEVNKISQIFILCMILLNR